MLSKTQHSPKEHELIRADMLWYKEQWKQGSFGEWYGKTCLRFQIGPVKNQDRPKKTQLDTRNERWVADLNLWNGMCHAAKYWYEMERKA